MNARQWKKIIMQQCENAGTMRDAFMPLIDTLSQVLERRDAVNEQFIAEGAHVCIDKVSDRGSVNKARNPLFQAWIDLNAQALTMWREMGCTAKGLKAITDSAMKAPEKDPLIEIVEKVERECGIENK